VTNLKTDALQRQCASTFTAPFTIALYYDDFLCHSLLLFTIAIFYAFHYRTLPLLFTTPFTIALYQCYLLCHSLSHFTIAIYYAIHYCTLPVLLLCHSLSHFTIAIYYAIHYCTLPLLFTTTKQESPCRRCRMHSDLIACACVCAINAVAIQTISPQLCYLTTIRQTSRPEYYCIQRTLLL